MLLITRGQTEEYGSPVQTSFIEAAIQHSVLSQNFPEGVIQALYTGQLIPNPDDFISKVNVSFLQPVTEISFSLGATRPSVFAYTAVNSQGTTINGSGLNSLNNLQLQFVAFNIDLPAGYYFTSLTFGNHDPIPEDGALWVKDISFMVPEHDPTLIFLVIGAIAVCGTKRLGFF